MEVLTTYHMLNGEDPRFVGSRNSDQTCEYGIAYPDYASDEDAEGSDDPDYKEPSTTHSRHASYRSSVQSFPEDASTKTKQSEEKQDLRKEYVSSEAFERPTKESEEASHPRTLAPATSWRTGPRSSSAPRKLVIYKPESQTTASNRRLFTLQQRLLQKHYNWQTYSDAYEKASQITKYEREHDANSKPVETSSDANNDEAQSDTEFRTQYGLIDGQWYTLVLPQIKLPFTIAELKQVLQNGSRAIDLFPYWSVSDRSSRVNEGATKSETTIVAGTVAKKPPKYICYAAHRLTPVGWINVSICNSRFVVFDTFTRHLKENHLCIQRGTSVEDWINRP